MKKFITAIALAAIASVSYGQLADSSGNISLVDGQITLNGTFKQLAGVEAKAPGGLNIGENPMFPGAGLPDVRPFTAATGTIVSNTETNAVIGVLGAGNRADFEGETVTGIAYTGATGDLEVSLGLGEDGPAAFPVVPEPATGLMAAFGLVGLLGLRRRR